MEVEQQKVLYLLVLMKAGRRTRPGQDTRTEDRRQLVSQHWKRGTTLASEITAILL